MVFPSEIFGEIFGKIFGWLGLCKFKIGRKGSAAGWGCSSGVCKNGDWWKNSMISWLSSKIDREVPP